jgi:hypothetical protein
MVVYWAQGLDGKRRLLARQKVAPRHVGWLGNLARAVLGLLAFWRWGRTGLDEGQRFH